MDFSGWIPPETKVLGAIAILAGIYLAYRVVDWLLYHLAFGWH